MNARMIREHRNKYERRALIMKRPNIHNEVRNRSYRLIFRFATVHRRVTQSHILHTNTHTRTHRSTSRYKITLIHTAHARTPLHALTRLYTHILIQTDT